MAKEAGIYKIINTITNKVYIGSASYIKWRFRSHVFYLKRNKHDNSYFQNAWNKYGEENFKFEILEIIEKPTKAMLIEREQHWIELYNANVRKYGYNLRDKANSNLGITTSWKGRNHSLETKLKISNSHMGKKMSLDAINKQSLRQKGKAPLNATLKAKEINRNKSKWPHELGSLCKCRECKDKWNEYHRNRRMMGYG